MRHKEISAIRMHASVKFAADFALGLVTEKLRSRIKFYVSIDAAKSIDRSLLPKEYGGEMPMAEMIGTYSLWHTAKQKARKMVFDVGETQKKPFNRQARIL